MDVYDLQEYHIPKNNKEKSFFMWTKNKRDKTGVSSNQYNVSTASPGAKGWTDAPLPMGRPVPF